MLEKSPITRFRYWARNFVSREIFRAIRQYGEGDVLDVGGRDFYLMAKAKGFSFKTWTTLEYNKENMIPISDENFKCILGDGCRMEFKDNSYDTVLNLQVLEHVFEPMKMVQEVARVLKSGGHGIFLIPQTSIIHELPYHYYNFTRFWIKEAMARANLEIVELKPLGGRWSSTASHLLHFLFQSVRAQGLSSPEFKRNWLFYFLFPFMALYAIINIPICLFFGLGDLTEEANNHLVIVKKP